MQTLAEMSARYQITMKKLRRMEKDGALNIAAADPIAASIERTFRNGDRLNALQLVTLMDSPEIARDFTDRHQASIASQIAALGTIDDARMAWLHLAGAAKKEESDLRALIDWIKATLPDKPVTHLWLAVRLLKAVPAKLRQFEAPRISRALMHARKHSSFASWFRVETIKGRKMTIYQRPEFDL